MFKKKTKILLVLILLTLLLHLFGLNRNWVEHLYSRGLYQWISTALRYLFGLFPFSMGDVLYGIFVFFLLWKLIKLISTLRFSIPAQRKQIIKSAALKAMIWLFSIYLVFNLFWGLNYNRQEVQYALGLGKVEYSKSDLIQINELLLEKTNSSRRQLEVSGKIYSVDSIYDITKKAYKQASVSMPFLNIRHIIIKPSMWNWLGNSAGFTGYYNPFTGEAQVNNDFPKFILPYVSCHEVAHQAGYAKENEANFVGYLAAINAHQPAFDYSVYFDLFFYANRNLYNNDSVLAIQIGSRLDTLVKQDLLQLKAFNDRHRNFTEPIIRWIYTIYLKGNKQPEGLLSYDKVTGFIIAYYKKFGKI